MTGVGREAPFVQGRCVPHPLQTKTHPGEYDVIALIGDRKGPIGIAAKLS